MRWLGGGSGAGKSTIAARLAAENGLRLFRTDDAIQRHVARADPRRHPLAHAFAAMGMDERWLRRSPAEMLATFHGYQGELFELIVEDLFALPSEPPILVEGFRLLPRLVAPLLREPAGSGQAVWLIPTPAFRRAVFEARGTAWHGAYRTLEPARALENLLARDALFTDQIEQDARAAGLPIVQVEIGDPIDSTVDRVRQALDLPPG